MKKGSKIDHGVVVFRDVFRGDLLTEKDIYRPTNAVERFALKSRLVRKVVAKVLKKRVSANPDAIRPVGIAISDSSMIVSGTIYVACDELPIGFGEYTNGKPDWSG